MSPSQIEAALAKSGYVSRRQDCLALAGMMAQKEGTRALLLEGPPGAGKTFLAEAFAQVMGAPLVMGQMHAWTDADELFVGVDVASAVAGDATSVRQPGLLAVAAERSQVGPVVVLLDEIDKTSERAECLLLDWLQSGRVPIQPGRHLLTKQEHCFVFLTSNAQRELSEALLRRVRRLAMLPLPVETQVEILVRKSGMKPAVVRAAWKLARQVAAVEDNHALSLQEGERLLAELVICESAQDVGLAFEGWAARTQKGRQAVRGMPQVATLWGELCRR